MSTNWMISRKKIEENYLALYRRGDRITRCMGMDRPGQVILHQRLLAETRPWDEALELARL